MVTGSYRERINYIIRPAKNIERKMMSEALRKLSHFDPIENYRYIGFGALYFSDFRLFHRDLGIKRMISIERNASDSDRYEFNRPFGCIEIMFEKSGDALQKVPWNMKTILWLDYQCSLNASVLDDIAVFCTSAQPGSVLMVTVNAEPKGNDPKKRYEHLRDCVGETKMPPGYTYKDMVKWKVAEVYREIITNHIHDIRIQRNGDLEIRGKIGYKQLFNFHYRDGTRMLTVGGLIHSEDQVGIVEKCAFDRLPFVTPNKTPYRIDVPNLTYREVRSLDRCLPVSHAKDSKIPNIPQEIRDQYAKVYRYFPRFVEAEM